MVLRGIQRFASAFCVSFCLLSIFLASSLIYGQVVGGTLSGTVTGQSGAIIPNARRGSGRNNRRGTPFHDCEHCRLSPAIVKAVAEGRRPAGMSDDKTSEGKYYGT